MINISYLKGLRAMKGDSQPDISLILDLSVQSYNKKENGKVPFTVNEVRILSEYFNVPVENFFNEEVAL